MCRRQYVTTYEHGAPLIAQRTPQQTRPRNAAETPARPSPANLLGRDGQKTADPHARRLTMTQANQMSAPPFLSRLNSSVPCTEQPQLFHPPDNGNNDHGSRGLQRTRKAKSLCRACAVMYACRQWARDQGEFGIWGAETDLQRLEAGYRTTVHGAQAKSLANRNSTPEVRTEPQTTMRRPAAAPTRPRPPRLTPVEAAVLRALSEGISADDLHAELARSHSTVVRALDGLQRKLKTDITGLVCTARESGLLQVLCRPAASENHSLQAPL
ncbi:WhiB family transcriptional regulator [Streptomyces sp. NPDC048527]|uniref:WhiB family transcriptional regulator n=1 Tax=Streptomyces sp. NPDC048527 TaxID=3365568 RepID=UPI00371F6E92